MKKHLLVIRLASLMLAVCMAVSLAACSKVGVLKPDEEGRYINDKTGIVYYAAPGYYSVTSYVAEEAVALNDGVNFYAVEGTENDEWLYSPDFGILLYAEGETLPTLAELAPTALAICIEDESFMDTIFEVESAGKIGEILDAYENGENLSYSGKKANYKFYLELTSEEYPWLVYNLLFLQYAEDLIVYGKDENGAVTETNYGKNFLYNRFDDRFVAIGDEMQEYIDEYYRNVDAE